MFIFDNADNNLIGPGGYYTIEGLEMENGNIIESELKDYSIDPDNREGIWHIFSISDELPKNCINNDCQFYLKLKSDAGIDVDTFDMRVEIRQEDGCTWYPTVRFDFNGEAVLKRHPFMGGYIIRKSVTR